MARILVLDSSAAQCAWLQAVLKQGGHSMTAVSELAQVRRQPEPSWQLNLVSLWLPGSNGFEAAPRLQKLTGAPAVLLLPRRLEADLVWGRSLGLRHFLHWPCQPAQLLQLIESTLAHRSAA